MFVKCFLKFYAQLFGFVFLADVPAFMSANRFLLSSNASPFDAAPAVIVVLLTLFAVYRRFCRIGINKKRRTADPGGKPESGSYAYDIAYYPPGDKDDQKNDGGGFTPGTERAPARLYIYYRRSYTDVQYEQHLRRHHIVIRKSLGKMKVQKLVDRSRIAAARAPQPRDEIEKARHAEPEPLVDEVIESQKDRRSGEYYNDVSYPLLHNKELRLPLQTALSAFDIQIIQPGCSSRSERER